MSNESLTDDEEDMPKGEGELDGYCKCGEVLERGDIEFTGGGFLLMEWFCNKCDTKYSETWRCIEWEMRETTINETEE